MSPLTIAGVIVMMIIGIIRLLQFFMIPLCYPPTVNQFLALNHLKSLARCSSTFEGLPNVVVGSVDLLFGFKLLTTPSIDFE